MNTKTKGLSCNFSIVGYLLWQVDDCLFRDDDENEFPIYALNPVSIIISDRKSSHKSNGRIEWTHRRWMRSMGS